MNSTTIRSYFTDTQNAAPLAVFRILFGILMLWSIVRFAVNGWIYKLYIEPQFFFSYYGFEWVQPIGEWTYLIF
ncbi:HTTM domain-containing protein, partial [Rhodohalobacter sp.]